MKTTLRDKLLLEIQRIESRIEQLRKFIIDHKENNDFESAMKCDIKYRQLNMVAQSLRKIL